MGHRNSGTLGLVTSPFTYDDRRGSSGGLLTRRRSASIVFPTYPAASTPAAVAVFRWRPGSGPRVTQSRKLRSAISLSPAFGRGDEPYGPSGVRHAFEGRHQRVRSH